jgi:hypothetical protein
LKPLHECLDIVLLRLVDDWNNYGDERKDLNCEDLMTSFGLEPQYKKHEFFIGLIDKLIKDGYAELITSRPFDSRINQYQKNTIITITGYYFILRDGGYTKELKKKKVKEFPNTYWYLVAAFAFIVGLFTDLAKTAISDKLHPKKTSSEQTISTVDDSSRAKKNHPSQLKDDSTKSQY